MQRHVLMVHSLYSMVGDEVVAAGLEVTSSDGLTTRVEGKVQGPGHPAKVRLEGQPPFNIRAVLGGAGHVVYTTVFDEEEVREPNSGVRMESVAVGDAFALQLQTPESLEEAEKRIRRAKWNLDNAQRIVDAAKSEREAKHRDALLALLDDLSMDAVKAALEGLFDGYAKALVDLGVQPPEHPFPRKSSDNGVLAEASLVLQGTGDYAFNSDGHFYLHPINGGLIKGSLTTEGVVFKGSSQE